MKQIDETKSAKKLKKSDESKPTKKLKIGVLTGYERGNKKLIDAIEKRGHEARVIDPGKIYQYISESERGYDRMYYGNKGNEPERITKNSLDIVINRIGSGTSYASAALRFMVENLGIWCPNDPAGLTFASNKAWTLQRLSSIGIKVPRTIICEHPAHIQWIVEKIGSLPIIIKTWNGSQGKTVGIADTKTSASSLFGFCYNAGLKVLIEEFVESDGTDIRAWVVGDQVPIAMKRTAKPGAWKSNISQGGTGEKVELSDEDKSICVRAAHAIGLRIAGVDLIRSKKTGASMIIEINSNPGTKIVDITGHNVFTDIVEYCELNYTKGQSRTLGHTPENIRAEGLQQQLITSLADVKTLQKSIEETDARYIKKRMEQIENEKK